MLNLHSRGRCAMVSARSHTCGRPSHPRKGTCIYSARPSTGPQGAPSSCAAQLHGAFGMNGVFLLDLGHGAHSPVPLVLVLGNGEYKATTLTLTPNTAIYTTITYYTNSTSAPWSTCECHCTPPPHGTRWGRRAGVQLCWIHGITSIRHVVEE